jgi:hypothetical protein
LPVVGYSSLLTMVMLVGFGTAGTSFGSLVNASRGMADGDDQGLVGGAINTRYGPEPLLSTGAGTR